MKESIREVLETMRKEYELMSYEDIISLAWVEKAPIKIKGKKYYPAIWSQTFPDKEALLVVQLTRWYFLKMVGATDCIGFTLTQKGDLERVDEHWLMNEVGHP